MLGIIFRKSSQGTLLVKDSLGGCVEISGCDKIRNFGNPLVDEGKANLYILNLYIIFAHFFIQIPLGVYCSVIGSLISNDSDTTLVKAIKITSLQDKPYMEFLWCWEVEDLQKELVKALG